MGEVEKNFTVGEQHTVKINMAECRDALRRISFISRTFVLDNNKSRAMFTPGVGLEGRNWHLAPRSFVKQKHPLSPWEKGKRKGHIFITLFKRGNHPRSGLVRRSPDLLVLDTSKNCMCFVIREHQFHNSPDLFYNSRALPRHPSLLDPWPSHRLIPDTHIVCLLDTDLRVSLSVHLCVSVCW